MSMRLLVWEFCTGTRQPVDHALMDEGRAMLVAAATDAASCAGVSVTVIGDGSLRTVIPEQCELLSPGDAESAQKAFETACRDADAVWLIAPETDDIAAEIAATVESYGCRIVGSSSSAIRACSDKLLLPQRLAAVGLCGVPTVELNLPTSAAHRGRSLSVPPFPPPFPFPMVIKPRFGAGGEGTFVVRDENEWGAAIAQVANITTRSDERAKPLRQAICQPWVESVPYSAGFVLPGEHYFDSTPEPMSRRTILALPGVVQTLRVNRGIEYQGGAIQLAEDWLSEPVEVRGDVAASPVPSGAVSEGGLPPTRTELKEIGVRLATAFPGLRGYFGVDLLRAKEGGLLIVDINPRLTTSYLGYRAIVGPEIMRACLCSGVGHLLNTDETARTLGSVDTKTFPRETDGMSAQPLRIRAAIRFPASSLAFDKAGRIRHCAAGADLQSQQPPSHHQQT